MNNTKRKRKKNVDPYFNEWEDDYDRRRRMHKKTRSKKKSKKEFSNQYDHELYLDNYYESPTNSY